MTKVAADPPRPPWWGRVLLAFFCPWHLREEVAGDLQELYRRRTARFGKAAARQMYLRDLRSLLRLADAGEGNRADQLDFLIAESTKGGGMASGLLRDIPYGLRTLAKTPGFTIVVVLSLALGIGANTAIYTLVEAALLSPLPYAEPERLVHLWEANEHRNFHRSEASYPDYTDWAAQNQVFEGLAGYNTPSYTLTDGTAERVDGAQVTSNFFHVLGVEPALGRNFRAGEEAEGAERVVILTHGFWQRRFGGRADMLGRSLTLNGTPHTVIGILPPSFQFALAGPGENVELWVPLHMTRSQRTRRNFHWLNVIGRLKPGVPQDRALSEMNAIAERLEQAYPETNSGQRVVMQPLQERVVGTVRPALLILFSSVGLVLLIICANVAGLFVVRVSGREKELAIRAALGASRGRLLGLLVTEGALLALAGCAGGVLFARWSVDILVAAIPAALRPSMPFFEGLQLNGAVLLFAVATGVFAVLLFAVVPGLGVVRADPSVALKTGGAAGRHGHKLRHVLVVAEVALALVLLTGTGLMLRSVVHLMEQSPGFAASHLLTFRIALPAQGYADDAQVLSFYDSLQERLQSLPGVRDVAMNSKLPLMGGGNTLTYTIQGEPEPEAGAKPSAVFRQVSPNYFSMMRIPLLSGRTFTEQDDATSRPVLIVNAALARQQFGKRDPVGRVLKGGGLEVEIIGVVGDVKIAYLDTDTPPAVYISTRQFPSNSLSILARTMGPLDPLVSAIREQVHALDAQVPVYEIRTMDDIAASAPGVFLRRYLTFLLAGFAGVAALLGAMGIYGVMAFLVTQRTHEIGIRMALGAQPRDVFRWVARRGLALAAVGVGAGLIASLGATRLLASQLFGIGTRDPATFAAAAVLLMVAALLACFLPARRAARVDPMVALRYE